MIKWLVWHYFDWCSPLLGTAAGSARGSVEGCFQECGREGGWSNWLGITSRVSWGVAVLCSCSPIPLGYSE